MNKPYFDTEAEMLAYKAWETLKLTPPVDLYRVAASLKIDITERDFDDTIDGIYVRLPDGFCRIAINTLYTKPAARRRFTLAHEIGHHLLSRKSYPCRQVFFVDGCKSSPGTIEQSCNQFAVYLLMPAKLVKEHYQQLSYNPENRLQILAERFGVSNWAMRRRLRELGLQVSYWGARNRAK